ncbi:hypothetical protein MW887_000860 [Aspergillus wentii]|nr:hypothetical protein MW887_000860 [Aspergillus wentii]
MAVYVDYQKNIRQATTLCQRCKVLEFDDKVCGGSIATSDDGTRYVSFEPPDRIVLEYELKDTLPDLPQLSTSITSGCKMCTIVKKNLLTFWNDYHEPHSLDIVMDQCCFQSLKDLDDQ